MFHFQRCPKLKVTLCVLRGYSDILCFHIGPPGYVTVQNGSCITKPDVHCHRHEKHNISLIKKKTYVVTCLIEEPFERPSGNRN
jgi:hypothetical protein